MPDSGKLIDTGRFLDRCRSFLSSASPLGLFVAGGLVVAVFHPAQHLPSRQELLLLDQKYAAILAIHREYAGAIDASEQLRDFAAEPSRHFIEEKERQLERFRSHLDGLRVQVGLASVYFKDETSRLAVRRFLAIDRRLRREGLIPPGRAQQQISEELQLVLLSFATGELPYKDYEAPFIDLMAALQQELEQ